MPRWLAPVLSLIIAAAVLVAFVLYQSGTPQSDGLRISRVAGAVSWEREGQVEDAAVGTALAAGDRVVTQPGASAVLSRGSNGTVHLGSDTRVRLLGMVDDVVELELELGQVRAKLRPDAGALRLSSRGRSLLAVDAELAAAVDEQGELAVEARRGAVVVDGVSGVSKVAAGERLLTFGDEASVAGPAPAEMLLDVRWPGKVRVEAALLQGSTAPGARVVLVGAQGVDPVRAGADGSFELRLPLSPGVNQVEVRAYDAFGDEIAVEGEVVRDMAGPRSRVELNYGRK